jgi:glutamate-1-semialdehyde 2,1-aminomutase
MNNQSYDQQLWTKARAVIGGGVQTQSKHPSRFPSNFPRMIRSAKGCFVEDEGGNVYTDYICALGPIILGYSDRNVDKAVREQILRGTLYPLSSKREAQLAQMLAARIPSAEKVKFFKTGSDVLTAAVRSARAFTGKEKVLVCGYHGWHDWYQISNPQNKGIPKSLANLVQKFKYNDIQSLRDLFASDDVACVVMEPVVFEEPHAGFLQEVQDLCHQHGALLVFDEVITGFRVHMGGAQAYFGVTPDLSCFSKAMGNGFPIGALVGRKACMDIFDDSEFFVSGTFGGDLVGISAAIQTIQELGFNDGLKLKNIWARGAELKDGFNFITEKLGLDITCKGLPCRTMFDFPSPTHRAVFAQEMCKRGVLLYPTNFINGCHTQIVVQSTLNLAEEVLTLMKPSWSSPEQLLEGDAPKEIILSR